MVSGQVASREHQHKDASEHFTQQSFSTIARWEDESWFVRGNIEQPAADTGAASAVTFCLHALPASISEKRISSPQTCQQRREKKKKKKRVRGVRLTAISISSALSLAWMAVNPPSSPNWKRQTNQTKVIGKAGTWTAQVDNMALYSLDSPNRPTNREAPKRHNDVE